MQLYGSRLTELTAERGAYTDADAQGDLARLEGISIDYVKELNYYDRKRIHNLKYFTWIEQQERAVAELDAQWYDHDNYWYGNFEKVEEIDRLIMEFNERVGLL